MSDELVNFFKALADANRLKIIGLLAQFGDKYGTFSNESRAFLVIGVLGGFTTFSAFSLEAALLWERGQVISCVLFVLASVCLSIAGVFAGLFLMRSWHTITS